MVNAVCYLIYILSFLLVVNGVTQGLMLGPLEYSDPLFCRDVLR